MALATITGNARIRKWVSQTIGAKFWIINKAIQMEDKFSFIRAQTPSKVNQEPLVFNISNRTAQLQYKSDERWDRARLLKNGIPVVSTYMGDETVPSPTRTQVGLGWKETISSICRIGDSYKKLWWFNSSDVIELHPNIWDVLEAGNYSLSYNKLTQYISYYMLLGEGESWYIDWQLYNRRTIDQVLKDSDEELVFNDVTLSAELLHYPVDDKTKAILYKHAGTISEVIAAEDWFFDGIRVGWYRRNEWDPDFRYSIFYQYYQPVESPIIDYTVELSQSDDEGETWTNWEVIYREFLVDKSKGSLVRYRLTVDEVDDINAFRFKAFCLRKVREVI